MWLIHPPIYNILRPCESGKIRNQNGERKMDALEFFHSSLRGFHANFKDAVKDLDDEQLHFRPLGKGNSIAFVPRHTIRTEDLSGFIFDPDFHKLPQIVPGRIPSFQQFRQRSGRERGGYRSLRGFHLSARICPGSPCPSASIHHTKMI